jgi:hypothetical protein
MATEKGKVMLVASIRIERLADGSARLTHPSGAVVVETKAHLDGRAPELKARIAGLQAELAALQEHEAAFTALPVTAAGMQEV